MFGMLYMLYLICCIWDWGGAFCILDGLFDIMDSGFDILEDISLWVWVFGDLDGSFCNLDGNFAIWNDFLVF